MTVLESGRGGWRGRFDRLDEVVGRILRGFSGLGAAAAMLIMVVMTADVLKRTFAGGSIAGAYEIVEVALVAVVFFGIAGAERSQSHVRVTLVTHALPRRAAETLRMIGMTIALVIVTWFASSTLIRAQESWESGEYKTGLLDFPLWPGRLVIAVGFSLLAIEIALTLVRRASTWAEVPAATEVAR